MRHGTVALAIGIIVTTVPQRLSEANADLVPILPEPAFCRALSHTANKLGLYLYVFSLNDYDPRTKCLFGYRLVKEQWRRQQVPLPDIIYDRCFFTNSNERQQFRLTLDALSKEKSHKLLNGRLPSKLRVYEAVCQNAKLAPYLPSTIVYQSASQLLAIADGCANGVIAKPSAGMQGRGIVLINRSSLDNTIAILGRTRSNRSFSLKLDNPDLLESWMRRFTRGSTYLIQPYLQLKGSDDRPFDVRILLQKDASGMWQQSGTAVRYGQSGTITSNLHGGGHAESAVSSLSAKYGKPKSERLLAKIHTISGQTAIFLEERFGRFAELAFDFGIEPNGRLWLLEVNSKPGRTSFRLTKDQIAQKHSIERPLLYAQYLSRRTIGYGLSTFRRFIDESDNL